MPSEAEKLTSIPHEWLRHMRATSPIFFDTSTQMWNIFRYDDVLTVLSNPTIFASEPYPGSPIPGLPSIMGMDDPRHRKLRGLASQALTTRMIADLAPQVMKVTDELIDAVIMQGEMDLAHDLAYPLPTIVIADLLGIPRQDRDKFREWSDEFSNNTPEKISSSPERLMWAIQSFAEYFRMQLKEHRRQPRADVISRLLETVVDGEKFSEQEILDLCTLLMVAGNETTASLISYVFIALQEHPVAMEELRADPSLISTAIEEVLRYYPAVGASERFTTKDVILGGVTIPARQAILFRIASANTDEARFEDPLVFNIRRNPNKHLTFGQGIHFCMGAPLARLEGKIVVSRLLQRLHNIQSVPGRPPENLQGFFTSRVRSFPITFSAAH